MKYKSFCLRLFILVIVLCLGLSISVVYTGCSSPKTKQKSRTAKSEPDPSTEEEPDNAAKDGEPTADEDKETAPTNKNAKSTQKPETKVKTEDSPSKAELTAIWTDLLAGNKRFMAGKHTVIDYAAAREKLVKGQSPKVIILGCSDSRVPPEFIFDKNLGELFVVRDAGNIADRITLGSIEYAVEHLKAKILVILGHESCGAVAATIAGEKMPTVNLQTIVDNIEPSFFESKTCVPKGDVNDSCIELNVKHSNKDILLRSPIVKKAVQEGDLMIVTAVYKLKSGEVVRLD